MKRIIALLLSLTAIINMAAAKQSIDIVFVGDAMMHQRQLDAARQPDRSYDFSACYKDIEPYIQSADYAVVNLELPLGGAPYSGYPMFCAPDSYVTPLQEAGFDLFLNANNHILDRHDKGLRRTLATLDSRGISHIGAYANPAQRDSILPFIADVEGFRIGFLNYTYGTNGISPQGNVVIDYIDRQQMASDIAALRNKGAEIIAVCIHWGDEYHLLPNKSQKSLAEFLAAQGVDLIIGGHPHVIQPMELTFNAQHNKNIFTCYSLGNFISAMRTTDTRGGGMARITIARDSTGRASIQSATYRMVFVVPPGNGNSSYRLQPAEDEAPAGIEPQRKAFLKNARNIFDKHNIQVPHDSVPMQRYFIEIRTAEALREIFPAIGLGNL